MTSAEIVHLQKSLNNFTSRYLKGIQVLHIDGKMGPATRGRIVTCKWYLGYAGPRKAINASVNRDFLQRLWHPRDPRFSSLPRIARGATRRRKNRREWKQEHTHAKQVHGLTHYDGIICAAWMVPYMEWARNVGHNGVKWHGKLVSGWRSKAYSQQLCYNMCGHPACPGRCAGVNTRHVGIELPAGAIDVSDYVTFGELMQHCPLSPKLYNALPNDRVHFSPYGN